MRGPTPIRYFWLAAFLYVPLAMVGLSLVLGPLAEVVVWLTAERSRGVYACLCLVLMLGQALILEQVTGGLARFFYRRMEP